MLSLYRPFPSLLIFTPCSGSTWVNSRLVNWLPWSVLPWSVLQTSGWTCASASCKASTQQSASRVLDNRQATTYRRRQSMMATK